ncbi:hypothetical protein FEM48_Zijuj03G0175200 [Ziziphus jujuba var. spinosa]|uniref:B3 domain-containing protein At2g27410 n=1 Tax=Ziziphus jujuba var. spinosa TaxID=714518 RepID=A0A978VRN9_ZIZJJ|nr:hypothetical protein FEM48_Zijuj03G0175200 [Ziziphus jujuba var. spinosa]
MMKMMLLSKEDFEGFKFNADQSGIDVLAQVCCVALEKFNRFNHQQRHHQNITNLGFQQQPQPQSAAVGNQEKALSSSKKTIKIVRKERKEVADDDLHHDQECQETHHHRNHGLNLRKTTSKRSRYDDNEDDDWELNVEPKKKKQKNDLKSRSRRIVRSSNFVPPAPMDPDFVPDLPEIFRRRIDEMQGTAITLVMQKQLTDTDLSPDHNRLMMPFTKIKDWDFLTENEKADLRAEGIMAVPLIEPEPIMKLTIVNMRQWDMAKPSGKASSCYVLRTTWKLVVKDNHLRPHEVAQVWSFRVHGRLHMALVVISRPPPPPVAVGMASTSGSRGRGSDGAESSASTGGGNGTESGSGQITS